MEMKPSDTIDVAEQAKPSTAKNVRWPPKLAELVTEAFNKDQDKTPLSSRRGSGSSNPDALPDSASEAEVDAETDVRRRATTISWAELDIRPRDSQDSSFSDRGSRPRSPPPPPKERTISWDLSDLTSDMTSRDPRLADGSLFRPPPPPSSASSVSSRRSSISSVVSSRGSSTDVSPQVTDVDSADSSEDDLENEIEGVEALCCVPHGGASDATIATVSEALSEMFGVPPHLQRLIRMRGALPELLIPASQAAAANVAAADALLLEAASTAHAPSLLLARREAQRHRLTLSFNSFDAQDALEYPNEITADARSTAVSLKRRIAARLRSRASVTGWPPARAIQTDLIRLRRSSRGAHITVEAERKQIGEGGLGLADGDVIFVERGAPLHDDEYLVRCSWCIPDELSLSTQESSDGRYASPPATATGDEDQQAAAPEERRRKSRTVSWATASEVSVLGGAEEPELASYASSSVSSRASSRSRSPRSRSRSQSPSASGSDAGSGFSSRQNSEQEDGSSDGEGEASPKVDAFASLVQVQPCASVAVHKSLPVIELKRRIRRALTAAGSHPPYQPAARVRASLPASRLRLYTRLGGRVGRPLRDDTDVSIGLSSGAVDKDVAVQIVSRNEHLTQGSRLLRYTTLDAASAPACTGALLADGDWSMAILIDELSIVSAIPRQQLTVARAVVGAGGHTLSKQLLGALTWDEPSLLACPKIALQLSDGDTLVIRDRMHPAPRNLAPADRSSGSAGSRRVTLGGVGGGSEQSAAPRRSVGVQIRSPRFDV